MRRNRRLVILVGAVIAAGVSLTSQSPSGALVLDVSGSATGYLSNVSLFGGPATQRGPSGTPGCDPTKPAPGPNSNTTEGCSPSVVLPSGGSATPLAATDSDGVRAIYGPAVLFGGQWPDSEPIGPPTGPISVTTQGTTGATGSVTSAVSITLAPAGSTWTVPGSTIVESWPGGIGPGPVVADAVSSTCRATDGGATGSTHITNGIAVTSTDSEGFPATTQQVPTEPPPNYGPIAGTINHVGDSFEITYNEQIRSPEGLSITVNAVHMKLLGPTAVGDLYIGQSKCAVVGLGLPTTTSLSSTTSSTSTSTSTTTSSTSTTSTTLPTGTRRSVADFDGNGASDVSVFRPAGGTWYLQGSAQQNFGGSGDIAVPADYDGDGKSDVAVFRPSNGVWYVHGSAGTDTAVAFGASGDVPVPADYDGDGKADRAVFRDGVWYVQGSGAVAFGASGDVPVPADYDGDAKADRAVFRNGVWYVKGSAGTDPAIAFGTSGDVPVPGDYDGNGTNEVAVFRPANGVWFVQGGAATAWGTNGDVPVPGDYDGNGDLEIAVFRPSNGVWFIQGGSTTAWGATGDVPLPLPAAVYRSMG